MPVSQTDYVEFDAVTLPAEVRFAAWAAAMPFHDVSTPDPLRFEAKVRAWIVPPLVVTDSRLGPLRFIRSPERIRADRQEDVTLQLMLSGHSTVDADGRIYAALPGDIAFQDMARPMDAASAAHHSIAVTISRAFLDDAFPGAEVHGVVLRGGLAGILRAFLTVLPETLEQASPGDRDEIARLLRDMIAAALRRAGCASVDEAVQDSALRNRVRRYVARNLTGALEVPDLCSTLGVSRSSLYRAFDGEGGIATYVQRRRLARLHRLFCDPAEHRSISELAALYGFVGKSHFSRLFRRTFGYGAREARMNAALGSGPPKSGTPQHVFNHWQDSKD